jgi:hypothetical protein
MRFLLDNGAEIGNASTTRLEKQAVFMLLEHFTLYMRYYICEFNKRKVAAVLLDIKGKKKASRLKEKYALAASFYETWLKIPKDQHPCSRSTGGCMFCDAVNEQHV